LVHDKGSDIGGLLKEVRKRLRAQGIEVNVLVKVRGRSGVEHDIDLVAEKGDKWILLDAITADSLIDETRLLPLLVKIYDTQPYRAVIIAIPGLTKEASRIARSCGLRVIEVGAQSNVLSEVERTILESLK
jgi:hypothetical protein